MHNITLTSAHNSIYRKIRLLVLLCSVILMSGRPATIVPEESNEEATTISSAEKFAASGLVGALSIKSNSSIDAVATNDGWFFECGDDKRVDEYGFNANCNETTTTGTLPDASSIYQYVVEIVYKGSNPGSSIQIRDSSNNSHTLDRSVPFGNSSNIWVYRGLIQGNTSSVTYTNNNNKCQLQSLVVYAFRNAPGASGSSGVFTTMSGYNDLETITIEIPSFNVPRDLIIETPVSELTPDGRYLKLKAEAAGKSDEIFLYGPDTSLDQGTCCLAIPTLILRDVPGDVTEVQITVDTRHNQNGQNVNGQSWVIASGVNVDAVCEDNPEIALIKTGTFNDENGNGSAEAGETVSYEFTVTNTGQTPLQDITIEDPLVTVSGSLASLEPGQSNNSAFTATYSITQADVNAGFRTRRS